MSQTDKISTWPADQPMLEATTCQLGRCTHCNGFLMMFEAADGRAFAIAHVGDSAAALKRWLADGLEHAS